MFELGAKRRPALVVKLRATASGCMVKQKVDVGAQGSKLIISNHVVENIEAVLPIGRQYIGMQLTVCVQ